MNVLITGALGWLGSALTATIAPGHRVRAFDIEETENAGPPSGFSGEMVWGSVIDFDAVTAAMQGQNAVIHAAMASTRLGLFSPGESAPFEVNVRGTYNILEAARRAGVGRVVLIAAAETHVAHPPGEFVDRNTPYAGTGSIYDLTKRLQESISSWFAAVHGMNIIALRLGDVVDVRTGRGKYDDASFERAVARYGLIDRFDVARACLGALQIDHVGYDLFHLVGTPAARRRFDTARAEAVLGIEFTSDFDPRPASQR